MGTTTPSHGTAGLLVVTGGFLPALAKALHYLHLHPHPHLRLPCARAQQSPDPHAFSHPTYPSTRTPAKCPRRRRRVGPGPASIATFPVRLPSRPPRHGARALSRERLLAGRPSIIIMIDGTPSFAGNRSHARCTPARPAAHSLAAPGGTRSSQAACIAYSRSADEAGGIATWLAWPALEP